MQAERVPRGNAAQREALKTIAASAMILPGIFQGGVGGGHELEYMKFWSDSRGTTSAPSCDKTAGIYGNSI